MNVLKVDFQSSDAAEQFALSLRNTGFGVLYNHPIDLELIEKVYQEWKGFFKDPLMKQKYLFKNETQDGYFPESVSEVALGHTKKDIKEFFHYYPWGQFPAHLSQDTHKLYTQLSQMAHTLLGWVEQALPPEISQALSMPLSNMIQESPQTLLRILHYPPIEGGIPKGAVRAAEHGDINLLTLLVGSTSTGLQVKDSEGQWHDVPCDRHSIAVNIGDMLELATQQFFRSTPHRVINPDAENSHKARLSMPLFLHPKPEVALTPDVTAREFLNTRLKKIGVLT